MKEERILFLCNCGNPEHQMIATIYPESNQENERYVFLEVLLRRETSIFRRIRTAIKYILLDMKGTGGDFTEIVLSEDHLPQLQHLVDYLSGPKAF